MGRGYLTSAETQAALADNGVILLWKAAYNGVMNGGRLRRCVHLLIRCIWPAIPARDIQHSETELLHWHVEGKMRRSPRPIILSSKSGLTRAQGVFLQIPLLN